MAEAARLLDAGQAAEAIVVLEGLAAKEPANVAAQFNLALAHSLAGHDEEAIRGFRRVLELKGDLCEAKLNLGQLLLKTGRGGEAEPLLLECAGKQPGGGKAAYLLARARAGRGDWRGAAEAMEKAVEAIPGDSALALELALYYEKSGAGSKAAELYRHFPEDAAARERLGLLQLEAGELAGAIGNLEAARRKGATPAVLYALATAYLRNQQLAESAEAARQLAAMQPADEAVRLFYGRILRDQRKYEDAAREFAEAVKIAPRSGEAWNELTAMLLLMKQYERALAALDKARELNGETPAYHYFRATMLDALHQPKAALESYRKFLDVSGGKYPDEEFKARQRAKVLERVAR